MASARILIVEDESIVAMNIEERLVFLGYEVVGAVGSAEQALGLVESGRPDLVLMDIQLRVGGMDGVTAAEQIHQRFGVPVVFLTAFAEEATLRRAIRADSFGYILKPFEERELKPAIEMALYKHGVEKEIRRLNRLYSVLSHVSQAIVRVPARSELLSAICRVSVEQGQFQTAWVAWREAGLERTRPVAQWGRMDSQGLGLEDEGWPADTAIRTGQPAILNHLHRDAPRLGWGQAAAAFPIAFQGRMEGALCVCAAEEGFFQEKEIRLMGEVVSEVSYALDNLERESQRQKAVEALRASEQRYQHIVESANDWIWEINPEGVYTFASPRVLEVLGYAPEEILGRTLFDFMPPEEAARVGRIFGEIAAQRQPFRGLENTNRHKNGHSVVLETNGVPFFDEAGLFCGYRGIDRDITERKRDEAVRAGMEAHLRQAQKLQAIGTLAGGIAHDFNNILGAILSFTELALDETHDRPVVHEWLGHVLAASNRAKDLVRQILAFSRQTSQDRHPLALEAIVKETLKMLRSTLPVTVEIQCAASPDLPPILADSTSMHQVLMNLCTNSAHAMRGAAGRLEVRLEAVEAGPELMRDHAGLRAGRHVRLTVRDTGHGMDEATMKRVFEPFFTTKGPGEGTGLGLSVVHGIVHDHDGMIYVASQPGQGTRFDLFFPALPGRPPQEPAGPAAPLPKGSDERVLFVDDEPALVRAAEQELRRLRYQPVGMTDPRAALLLLQSRPADFDLVVVDLTMPGMTGVEFVECVRQASPQIPIVLTTGFCGPWTPESLQEAGVTELMMKPLDMSTLAMTLERVLAPLRRARCGAADPGGAQGPAEGPRQFSR